MEREPHARHGWLLVIAFYLAGGFACWRLYEMTKPQPVMSEPYLQREADAARRD